LDNRNTHATNAVLAIVEKYSTVDIQQYGTSAQIYLHLNIWGDDFDEMIADIAQATGADFSSFSYNKYAPMKGAQLLHPYFDSLAITFTAAYLLMI
jgi:hypothetical protein